MFLVTLYLQVNLSLMSCLKTRRINIVIIALCPGKFCTNSSSSVFKILQIFFEFFFFFYRSDLKTCARCRHMFYCDRDCQKMDWNIHKHECKIYKNHYFTISHNVTRNLLRLFYTCFNSDLRDLSQKIPGTDPPQYRTYRDLPTRQLEIENDPDAVQQFKFHEGFLRRAGCKFDTELYYHYCVASGNSFEIQNFDMDPIGFSIFILESGFENSCNPNADLVFNGINLETRAIKKISPGEKIAISRIDLKIPRVYRSTTLQKAHFFTCSCSECTTDDNEGGKFFF